jgi:alcohol dehydrogenase, propanol-preferring
MRAVRLERFRQPLVIRDDAPEPTVGPGEVLLRVIASGVCGTDVKIWRGDLPDTPTPLIPGHEIAARVEEYGPGSNGPAVGSRVVVLHHLHCGDCMRCRSRSSNLCDNLRGRIGFDHDGGWADLLVVPSRNVLGIPEGVPATKACVVPDAVATVWRAVLRVGALEPGEGVVVVGAGGLGLAACQIAERNGGEVVAVDVSAEKLELARGVGARHAALPGEAREAVRELPGGEARLVLDCAGTPEASSLAVGLLGKAGRLVQVGYAKETVIQAPAAEVALRELRILGCRAASIEDVGEALNAVGCGLVKPLIGEIHPLEHAQTALELLIAGAAGGRQVLVVSKEEAESE